MSLLYNLASCLPRSLIFVAFCFSEGSNDLESFVYEMCDPSLHSKRFFYSELTPKQKCISLSAKKKLFVAYFAKIFLITKHSDEVIGDVLHDIKQSDLIPSNVLIHI